MGKNKEPPTFCFEYYTAQELADAINLATRWFYRTYRTKTLGCWDIEDLISKAFIKLADGDRRWEPDKYELGWILVFIIRSDASHEIPIKDRMIALENDQLDIFLESSDVSRPISPDDDFELNQLLDLLKTRVIDSGDKLLIELFMCVYHRQSLDESDNCSLSDELDISIRELLNVKKRLKRLINSLKNEVTA